MHKNPLSILRLTLYSLFFLMIALYALFQAHKYILGPVIRIDSPQNGAVYSSAFVEIDGRAQNISYLNLNGRKIFTDKNGYFAEKLLLSPGYNILVLDAKDKFGASASKKLELILKEY